MAGILREDVPVALEGDGVELRMSEVGEMTIAFVRLAKGVNLAPALEGLPDDLCQCPHWGYLLRGRVRMRTNDGDEVYEAGRPFYWAPGHAPEALEDSEYVDFSPTEAMNEVINHVKRGAAAAPQT
jgi:hypothetical protein